MHIRTREYCASVFCYKLGIYVKPLLWSFVDTLQATDERGNNGLPDVSAVASSDVGITSPAQVY